MLDLLILWEAKKRRQSLHQQLLLCSLAPVWTIGAEGAPFSMLMPRCDCRSIYASHATSHTHTPPHTPIHIHPTHLQPPPSTHPTYTLYHIHPIIHPHKHTTTPRLHSKPRPYTPPTYTPQQPTSHFNPPPQSDTPPPPAHTHTPCTQLLTPVGPWLPGFSRCFRMY